jgi:peroxiredoxin
VLVGGATVYQLIERRSASATAQTTAFKIGDRAEELPGVRYQESTGTIVLYLRSTCSFCTNSMPFYRTLSERAGVSKGVRLVAVSPEDRSRLSDYIQAHQLRVDEAVTFSGARVPTPTLVLVDTTGVIRGAWVGQQEPSGENEIVRTIDELL